MKKLFIISVVLFFGLESFSQQSPKPKNKKEEKRKKIDALIKQEEEGVVAYKKHFSYGGKLISDGFGFFIEKGKANSIRKATLYQLEIGERKHQKETSTISFLTGTTYTYGKINFVYPVKLGVQQQFLLGNKTNKNGVSISGNYGGGLSIALLRPYELQVTKSGQNVFIRYESADSSLFVNSGAINGGPTLSNGWNGLKVTPGAYAKTALRFDYGKYNEMISALEIGLTAEFYSKKIPQMVYNKQRNFFFNAYVALVFGKRK